MVWRVVPKELMLRLYGLHSTHVLKTEVGREYMYSTIHKKGKKEPQRKENIIENT